MAVTQTLKSNSALFDNPDIPLKQYFAECDAKDWYSPITELSEGTFNECMQNSSDALSQIPVARVLVLLRIIKAKLSDAKSDLHGEEMSLQVTNSAGYDPCPTTESDVKACQDAFSQIQKIVKMVYDGLRQHPSLEPYLQEGTNDPEMAALQYFADLEKSKEDRMAVMRRRAVEQRQRSGQ